MKKYLSSYWIRSAFYAFLQRFSVTLFGLINFMLLARGFANNPANLGIWALFLVVTTIFETTKTALLKNAHVRFVSGNNSEHEKAIIASSSMIINLALTVAFILFILLFAPLLGKWLNTGNELAVMLHWFIPGLICMMVFSHLEAIQQSNLDFKAGFAGYFVRQFSFFLVLAIYYFLKIPFSLTHLALYQSASIFIGTIVMYLSTRKYLLHQFKPSMLWVKKIVGFGGYIFGSGIMAAIFSNLDQVLTATMRSPGSVAYYNTASRINSLIDMPSFVAADILFPKSSRASYEEGPAKVKYLFERMVAVLMAFTTPVALFIIIFPKFVITIVASAAYVDAALILQLYMIGGILRPMQNQAASLLNSVGKPGLCFVINALTIAVNVPINYFCLLYFGFYGAAIGTLITLALSMLTWYLIMRKQIGFEFVNVIQQAVGFYKMLFSRSMALLRKTA